jgi:hypothetical protein
MHAIAAMSSAMRKNTSWTVIASTRAMAIKIAAFPE